MIPIGKIDVTYVDHMGDDLTSVNAARVSFGKTSDWEDCTSGLCLSYRDVKLIKFFMLIRFDRLISKKINQFN